MAITLEHALQLVRAHKSFRGDELEAQLLVDLVANVPILDAVTDRLAARGKTDWTIDSLLNLADRAARRFAGISETDRPALDQVAILWPDLNVPKSFGHLKITSKSESANTGLLNAAIRAFRNRARAGTLPDTWIDSVLNVGTG